MSDWQVGDLLEIINSKELICSYPVRHMGYSVPPVGTVGRVRQIYPAVADDGTVCGCIVLELEGWGEPIAQRCKKIHPDTEPCEEEFTVLIKRMKPAKVKS